MTNVKGYNKSIKVSLDVEGIHYWMDAPEEVSYLRYPHRHLFHIVVEFKVNHNNRDLEFIIMKHKIEEFIKSKYYNKIHKLCNFVEMSCEALAELILDKFEDAISCEVWEDKENGARLERRYND